jgi:lysophospholipase L1-like esterase
MAPVLKTGVPEKVSGVRIPPLPPSHQPANRQQNNCDGKAPTMEPGMKRIAFTSAACFLACALHAQNATPTPADHPRVLNVVYIGDSITQGATLKDPSVESPPVRCTADLSAQLPDTSIYMANDGHGGHTTVDFLPATNTDFPKAEADAHRLQQEHAGTLVFSIMLGTNDSAESGPKGSPVSPSQYLENMQAIVGKLKTDFPDSLVILHHPTWYSPNTANTSEYGDKGLARLQTYFSEIDAAVASFPADVYVGDVSGFDRFLSLHEADLTPQPGRHGTFYLHPNKDGAILLGKLWARSIAEHLPH